MTPNLAPSATPYDIVPIPSFPFIPPLWFWLVAILIANTIYFSNKYLINRSRRINVKKFDIIKGEIKKNISQTLDSNTASRLSLMLKRLLSSESNNLGADLFNLPALSEKEIESIAAKASEPVVKDLLNFIRELESVRFQIATPKPELATNLLSLIVNLQDKLGRIKS